MHIKYICNTCLVTYSIAEVSARMCRFDEYVLSQEAFLVTVQACTLLVGGFRAGVTEA